MNPFLARAIQLAKNGLGTTYPNPLVGAVVVYEDRIIGEGWHRKAGLPHAEVIAIQSVENKELLPKSTLYVTLEPCSHYGKTPPCSLAIIEHKILRVVVGALDPFPQVKGSGIQMLKNSSVEVEVLNNSECIELNKRFFTYNTKKRPYIFLKWAETADGFISGVNSVQRLFISNKRAFQHTHLRRSQEQAIVIGKKTAVLDFPELTVRHVCSKTSPFKIVIDPNLELPKTHPIFKNGQTLIFNGVRNFETPQSIAIKINFEENTIPQILKELYKKEIQSLIVEGGSFTLNKFIESGFWDEAEIYHHSKMRLGSGLVAPKLTGTLIEKLDFEDIKYTRLKNSACSQ